MYFSDRILYPEWKSVHFMQIFFLKYLTVYNHNPFLKVIILIYLSEYVEESETVSH